jgi:hypothetical protein
MSKAETALQVGWASDRDNAAVTEVVDVTGIGR